MFTNENAEESQQQQHLQEEMVKKSNTNLVMEVEGKRKNDQHSDRKASPLDQAIEEKRKELDVLRKRREEEQKEWDDEIRHHRQNLEEVQNSFHTKMQTLQSSISKIALSIQIGVRHQGSFGGGNCPMITFVQECIKEQYIEDHQHASIPPPTYVINHEVALVATMLTAFQVLHNQIRVLEYQSDEGVHNKEGLIPYLKQERDIVSKQLDESNHQSLSRVSQRAEQNTTYYDELQLQLDALEWERKATETKLMTLSQHSTSAAKSQTKHHDKDDDEAESTESTLSLSEEEDTERSGGGWDDFLSSLPWGSDNSGRQKSNHSYSSKNNNDSSVASFHCDEDFTDTTSTSTNNTGDDAMTAPKKDDDSTNHFADFLNSSIGNIQKFSTATTTAVTTRGWLGK